MIIAESKQTKTFDPVPSGNHVARCYSMIHIGTIEDEYQGEKKRLNKVRITWELPNETKVFNAEKGEQPYSISKEYTLSMHEKATLRHDLESWRGKGFTEEEANSFDITKLLGKPCMLNVIHKTSKSGNQYSAISSISSIPKGMVAPEQVNDTFEFSYNDFSQSKFDSLPDWLKDKMRATPEYKKATSRELDVAPSDVNEDSDLLPF
jgi:hypothetical protein